MFNNQFSMCNVQGKSSVLLLATTCLLLVSCSVQQKIAKSANKDVLNVPALKTAHVGISIYEPATNKYWFNYQGDKYFVPASNTKIPTCYAAMKYLGDSLVGLKYAITAHTLTIWPNADPTFLLPEFRNQPILEFLKKNGRELYISLAGWQARPLGSGWSWNDYEEPYMAERSAMPVYGNTIQFSGDQSAMEIFPGKAADTVIFDTANRGYVRDISRSRTGNKFTIIAGGVQPAKINKTFDTQNGYLIEKLLSDTLKAPVIISNTLAGKPFNLLNFPSIKTQPTDSLLKPMMHRSDNFFAEQSLLMVSNEKLGFMSDQKIIDTLLKMDFKDLPQKPRWVDGSGLSRYNLFTPQDMVAILHKMQQEFPMSRIKEIFPTGGEGTISSYYKPEAGYIYAKTGTLSGVVALSGYLYTRENKLLIFSVLVNNHQASSTDVRKAVEKFIQGIRKKY